MRFVGWVLAAILTPAHGHLAYIGTCDNHANDEKIFGAVNSLKKSDGTFAKSAHHVAYDIVHNNNSVCNLKFSGFLELFDMIPVFQRFGCNVERDDNLIAETRSAVLGTNSREARAAATLLKEFENRGWVQVEWDEIRLNAVKHISEDSAENVIEKSEWLLVTATNSDSSHHSTLWTTDNIFLFESVLNELLEIDDPHALLIGASNLLEVGLLSRTPFFVPKSALLWFVVDSGRSMRRSWTREDVAQIILILERLDQFGVFCVESQGGRVTKMTNLLGTRLISTSNLTVREEKESVSNQFMVDSKNLMLTIQIPSETPSILMDIKNDKFLTLLTGISEIPVQCPQLFTFVKTDQLLLSNSLTTVLPGIFRIEPECQLHNSTCVFSCGSPLLHSGITLVKENNALIRIQFPPEMPISDVAKPVQLISHKFEPPISSSNSWASFVYGVLLMVVALAFFGLAMQRLVRGLSFDTSACVFAIIYCTLVLSILPYWLSWNLMQFGKFLTPMGLLQLLCLTLSWDFLLCRIESSDSLHVR